MHTYYVYGYRELNVFGFISNFQQFEDIKHQRIVKIFQQISNQTKKIYYLTTNNIET